MGFFVMIAQRTNGHVFPALGNSANASMRLVSSFYLFCADFHFGRASQLSSLVDFSFILKLQVPVHAMMKHGESTICCHRFCFAAPGGPAGA
jgi:hypothetical protein